jgi:hypothetical protein
MLLNLARRNVTGRAGFAFCVLRFPPYGQGLVPLRTAAHSDSDKLRREKNLSMPFHGRRR